MPISAKHDDARASKNRSASVRVDGKRCHAATDCSALRSATKSSVAGESNGTTQIGGHSPSPCNNTTAPATATAAVKTSSSVDNNGVDFPSQNDLHSVLLHGGEHSQVAPPVDARCAAETTLTAAVTAPISSHRSDEYR